MRIFLSFFTAAAGMLNSYATQAAILATFMHRSGLSANPHDILTPRLFVSGGYLGSCDVWSI